ncbi:DNA-binding protein [Candidatus Binatia bacterium]|jgi:hypothetical protein|nr:DNA-binding protein [Candidatus Binatia bacterium]
MGSMLAAAAVVAYAVQASAQPGRAARTWDPQTVETVSGEVTEVQRVAMPHGKAHGVHLVLKTDATAALGVHLGPAWYVDRQPVKIAQGDRVTIKGSRVTIDGKSVLLAAEVQKGDQALVLRDANGIPKWGGGGRKRGPRATPGS